MKKKARQAQYARQRGFRQWGVSCLALMAGIAPVSALAQTVPDQTAQTVQPPEATQNTTPAIKATSAQPPVPVTPEEESSVPRERQYQALRFNEDWSFLKDPSKRTNFLDPLKYIPLPDGRSYLTLFGQERWRNINESTRNVAKNSDSLNFTGIRTDLGGDLHITPYFRGFLEFVSGYDVGSHIGTRPASFQNPLDVLQAFIEPKGKIGNADVGLRLGREVFRWGNGTVVDVNDFPNVQVAFDAIHPYVQFGDTRVDAFVSDLVLQRAHTFEDNNTAATKLNGVYVSHKYGGVDVFGTKARGVLEAFFFDYHAATAKYGTLTGSDKRQDWGLRFTANVGGFDFDDEALLQTGTFANRTVSAWAYFSQQGYTFRDVWLKPRIGIQADGASGGVAKSGQISTYQPLFPSALYLADMSFFAASNLIDFRPSVTVHFTPKVSLQAFYGFYWRQNQNDAIYATSPFKVYGTTNTAPPKGALIGRVPQLLFAWDITPQLLFTQYASYLEPASALKQAGGGHGDVFFASTLSFRF